ncbi:MAG: hypothetical protein K0Q53_927 [Massilibacillus sp.]|jgi:hypothetical protein|nr:hypothetical protein [Massilibacillus sp.]
MEAVCNNMKELLKLLVNVWAVPKNRRMVILSLVIMTGFYVLFMQARNVKQEAAAQIEVSTQKDKVQSTLLQTVDRNEHNIMQDPFAAPRSFGEKEEMPMEKETKAPAKEQKISPPVKTTKLPVVTGIVGSGNRFIAILEYGEVSKQCLLEDFIGPYQVVEIDEKNVIVNGPNGEITLTVGR